MMAEIYVHPFGNVTTEEAEYIEAVKLAFGAKRFGWSRHEHDACIDAYYRDSRPTPESLAHGLGYQHAVRKANRNV